MMKHIEVTIPGSAAWIDSGDFGELMQEVEMELISIATGTDTVEVSSDAGTTVGNILGPMGTRKVIDTLSTMGAVESGSDARLLHL